jgi:hypothetical protein
MHKDDKHYNKKTNWVLIYCIAVTLLASAICFGYNIDCERRVVTWETECARLRIELNDIGSVNYSEEDILIIDWCYSNAAQYVPKSVITRIVMAAKKYPNYLLILSIITEESHFNQYAKSEKEAKGLGQIMTSIWLDEMLKENIWQEEVDVYDTSKNIAGCNYILNKYFAATNGWKETLLKYVNGDSNYVTKVLSNFAELTLLLANHKEGKKEAGNTEVSTTGG